MVVFLFVVVVEVMILFVFEFFLVPKGVIKINGSSKSRMKEILFFFNI